MIQDNIVVFLDLFKTQDLFFFPLLSIPIIFIVNILVFSSISLPPCTNHYSTTLQQIMPLSL